VRECFSSFVKLKTGTHQDDVISPSLFTIFIDDELVKVDKSGFACRIRYMFFPRSVAERIRCRVCNEKIAASNPASGRFATHFRKEI